VLRAPIQLKLDTKYKLERETGFEPATSTLAIKSSGIVFRREARLFMCALFGFIQIVLSSFQLGAEVGVTESGVAVGRNPKAPSHYQIRRDQIDSNRKLVWRYFSKLHRIPVGATHANAGSSSSPSSPAPTSASPLPMAHTPSAHPRT